MPSLVLPLALDAVEIPGQAPANGAAPPVTAPANNTAVVGPAAAPGAAPATQGSTTQSGTTITTQAGSPPSPWTTMIPIVLMFVVLYFVLFRGQKKEEKRRKALIAEMKKGDRVLTIGGLIGRVVSIDNDEVVLKIDESANVKATYKKSSIHQVLSPGDEKTK